MVYTNVQIGYEKRAILCTGAIERFHCIRLITFIFFLLANYKTLFQLDRLNNTDLISYCLLLQNLSFQKH